MAESSVGVAREKWSFVLTLALTPALSPGERVGEAMFVRSSVVIVAVAGLGVFVSGGEVNPGA
jgi:hypothetical protein